MSEKSCLYLSDDPIRFEPVGSATSVFFDESNEQLIIARSNGAGGVVVKSSKSKNIINLRLEDKGEVRSMNFSPNSRTLAIHRRNSKSVDFINVAPGWDAKEFSLLAKAKGAKVLGIFWPGDMEVVVVTDKGVEHYQLQLEKRTFKSLKSLNQDINWFFWNVESSTCVISSGPQQNVFHILHFKDLYFTRYPKFEIEMPYQQCLSQRDILLLNLYNQLYICHVVVVTETMPVQLHLYQIRKEGLVRKSDVVLLDVTGRVVISLVDNLIVVHHQNTKTSLLFDILLDSAESVDGIKYHTRLCNPLPIRSFKLPLEAAPTSGGSDGGNIELYSSSWAIFGPDVVLDAKLGFYWNIKLHLEALVDIVSDKSHLMDILMTRKNSKSLVLKVCHDLIAGQDGVPLVSLEDISKFFDNFNRNLAEVQGKSPGRPHHLIVEQSDIHQHVFCKLEENEDTNDKFLNSVIIEYLLSLSNHQIPTQSMITDLFINRLILQKDFSQLQQLLQYHVIQDSKTVAFKLLSIENKFPSAYQLAVDMLKRLNTSNESILEIFLSKNLLLTAIRFSQATGLSNQLLAQRLLDVAMTMGDDLLFYSIYNYFKTKNFKQRGSARFYPGDGCDPYVEYYKSKFPTQATT